MGFGDSIAIPLAYGCAFFAPFQGRPTGGGKIVIKCSKIATGHRQAAKRSIKSPGATALASPAGSILHRRAMLTNIIFYIMSVT
jgi:hypothetical protein